MSKPSRIIEAVALRLFILAIAQARRAGQLTGWLILSVTAPALFIASFVANIPGW